MTEQELQEQQNVSDTVENILANRERRFVFLAQKDRVDDAIAVADEFYEWFAPEHQDDEDLIQYFCIDELKELYKIKCKESKRKNR